MDNKSSNGTLILVLGILSLVCLPILGPVAWIMGNNAINAGVDESQRGTVNAGRICGIIGTVFMVLSIVGAILGAVGIISLPPFINPGGVT
jgi:hypothetical protein